MNFLYLVAGLVMLIGTPVYLHAVAKLYGIVASERPEWVARQGSLGIFYSGMPKLADPNVSLAVVSLAFGSRWRELGDSTATSYVKRIRVFLPVLLATFMGVLALAIGSAA